jgi:flagellar biosynthesis/type III secretory pathway protein FliH
MPSLYKRETGVPIQTRQIPVNAVTVPCEPNDSELSSRIEEHIAQEVDRRWRDACARLEAEHAELRRVAVAEAEKAWATAREEGYACGLSEAQAMLTAEMALVRQAYTQLEGDRLAFIAQSQRDIIALALRIAEAALRAELSTNPSALLALFQSAYDELVAQRKVFIFVHPDNLSQVEALKHRLPLPADGPLVIRPDSTLDRSSFRLEDELGGVRYDLPAELRCIEAKVRCHGV